MMQSASQSPRCLPKGRIFSGDLQTTAFGGMDPCTPWRFLEYRYGFAPLRLCAVDIGDAYSIVPVPQKKHHFPDSITQGTVLQAP